MLGNTPEALSYFINQAIFSLSPESCISSKNHSFTNIVVLLGEQSNTSVGPEGPITDRAAVVTNLSLTWKL